MDHPSWGSRIPWLLNEARPIDAIGGGRCGEALGKGVAATAARSAVPLRVTIVLMGYSPLRIANYHDVFAA